MFKLVQLALGRLPKDYWLTNQNSFISNNIRDKSSNFYDMLNTEILKLLSERMIQ